MSKLLEFLIAWIVGVVLAVSAFAHLEAPYHFLDAIMQYGLVPETIARPLARLAAVGVAVFAPFFQLVLAFCLISGVMRDTAYSLAMLLFLGFASVQTYAWFAGLGIPCGCFGANDTPIGAVSLSIVYGMLGLTLLRMVLQKRRQFADGRRQQMAMLAFLLLIPSPGVAQELSFPPDSREESARIATAALFQHFAVDAESSHFSTPKEIADALTDHGLFVRYFTHGKLGDLNRAKFPVLLQWKTDWSSRGNTRWVLLLDITDNKATVIDSTFSANEPTTAPTTVSTAELLARWNGVGMVVSQDAIGTSGNHWRHLPLGVFLLIAYLVWEFRKTQDTFPSAPTMRYDTARHYTVWHCTAILVTTLLLGAAYHLITPTGLLRNPAAAEIVTGRFALHVPELTLTETKQRLKQGGVTLFDTREAEKFAEGTIDGAVNFPIHSTLAEREILLADVPRPSPIILFCQSNRCSYADDIARFLRHNGYENVAIYREGLRGGRK